MHKTNLYIGVYSPDGGGVSRDQGRGHRVAFYYGVSRLAGARTLLSVPVFGR